MAFNIKDFLSSLAVKVKSTTDGANGEVTHHNIDNFGAAGDSPPALATNATGLIGWLRKIVDVLTLGATAARQDTANASLASIDGRLAGTLSVSVGEIEVKNDAGNPVPVAGPLTDTQLRTTPVPISGSVAPTMANGGNIEVQTNATGANFTPFGAQGCKQLTIANDSGATIVWRQGGAGVAIAVPDQSSFTIFGLTNASQIEVRRKDQSNVQVMVGARWEA